MAMALSEMTTRLRGLITEPTEDRFPDEDSATLGIGLYTLLSDGIRIFCAETEWTKSTGSFTVTGNDTVSDSTRIYSLIDEEITDCLMIDKDDVTFKNIRILPITKKELHTLDLDYDENNASDEKWIEQSGTPKFFYMEKEDVIGLYPAPDADNNGETLRLSYYEDPAAITTSTAESPILWDLTWAAIYWAASKVFENDGDQTAADRYEAKFWGIVQRTIRRKENRERRKPLQTMAHRQYTINPDSWIEPYDVGQRGS